MKKIKLNGKTMLMALSFFAFMILGSVSASAQWVSPSEAIDLIKDHVTALDDDFSQASNDEDRYDLKFEIRYYEHLMHNIASLGMEVPTAIEEAKPVHKPEVASSGLVYASAEDPNFKNLAQALVDGATVLLSE